MINKENSSHTFKIMNSHIIVLTFKKEYILNMGFKILKSPKIANLRVK
jgi:hypothetical protein